MALSIKEKAELFDYFASRLREAKIITNFGGSEWIYHEQGSSESLAQSLRKIQEYEEYSDEDEED